MSAQNGEDEIIESLIYGFEKRGTPISKTCLEVGATDGVWFSNTHRLWKEKGFKAMLIESDDSNFTNLLNNTKGYDCLCMHRRISPTGEDSLDMITARAGFPTVKNEYAEIGVMSIDIDGDDYYIFKEMKLRPWILIIEFNATIPPDIDLRGKLGQYIGCSALALTKLATEKGYMIEDIVGSNIIMTRNDLESQYQLDGDEDDLGEMNLVALHRYFKWHSVRYLISDYAGKWAVSAPPVYGFAGPIDHISERIEGDSVWTPQQ